MGPLTHEASLKLISWRALQKIPEPASTGHWVCLGNTHRGGNEPIVNTNPARPTRCESTLLRLRLETRCSATPTSDGFVNYSCRFTSCS